MPAPRRARPAIDFDEAARRLFRNLRNPSALRDNPLVRRFFLDPATGVPRATQLVEVAETVGNVVRRAAECLRQADLDAGLAEQAHRHYTITMRLCFERASALEVARELNLSARQLFREKSVVCRRVAQYVQSAEWNATPPAARVFDIVDFHLERAKSLDEVGRSDEALRAYKAIADCAPNAKVKIVSLCSAVDVARGMGRDTNARALLDAAAGLLERNESAFNQDDANRLCLRHADVSARLLWETGEFDRAREQLAQVARVLESTNPPPSAFRGRASIHALRSMFLGIMGDPAAHREVALARKYAERGGSLHQRCSYLRHQTTLPLLDGQDAQTLFGERLTKLNESLTLARMSNGTKEIARSLAALMSLYNVKGDHVTALAYASQAIEVARSLKSSRFCAEVAMLIYAALYDKWQPPALRRFLEEALAASPPGGYLWYYLKLYESTRDLQQRHYAKALSGAEAAEAGARKMRGPILLGASLRVKALAADALGRRADAIGYIESALPLALQFGGSVAARLTQQAALKIMAHKADI
jgi:tetratricopeptide (TPR) repeat protein